MRASNKAKNTTQQVRGRLKGAIGRLTGDESLKAVGRADRVIGNLKQAGEKVRDAFKK